MKLNDIVNVVKSGAVKHTPEILIGTGLAGMLASTIMAAKATPKAQALLEEERILRERYNDPDMTKFDVFKTCWKPYVPAALGYCASAALILGAHSIDVKRGTMIAGAYKMSEFAFSEYRSKVKEVIGEEKEKDIQGRIAQNRVEQTSVPAANVIVGSGNSLCYDMISGRYFYSDMDKIQRVENILNRRMLSEGMVSLNEFYSELGIGCIDAGYVQGWNVDDGMIEIRFTSTITDENQLCLVVGFDNAPKPNFDRWS